MVEEIKRSKTRLVLYGFIVAILAVLCMYFVVPAAIGLYRDPLGAYTPQYLFTSKLEAMNSTVEDLNSMRANSTILVFENNQTIEYVYLWNDVPQIGATYKVYLCWDTTYGLDYKLVEESY
jgi:hypothetical protein